MIKQFFRGQLVGFFAIALLISLAAGCGQTTSTTTTTGPIFTDPLVKIATLSESGFCNQLYSEALTLNPYLAHPNTQVHMGYWSVYANRGYLMTMMDAINGLPYGKIPADIAIWDEGVSTAAAMQYPAYILMNNEYWYERSGAVGGVVTINGVAYTDPHPVTFAQADEIWGQYSKRYAEMATLFKAVTGKTVDVRCFVQGAKSNRIFYAQELPKLVSLEATGAVNVYFAKVANADWQNSADWTFGTANAPTPVAASSISLSSIPSTIEENACQIADQFRAGNYGSGPAAYSAAIKTLSECCPDLSPAECEAAFYQGLRRTAF